MILLYNSFIYILFTFVTYNMYSKKKYQENTILPSSYRQINFVKAWVLGCFSPIVFYFFYTILFYHYISYLSIMLVGAIYASLDMSSMLYHKNHHISTLFHHISVQLLYFYCIYKDWNIHSLVLPIILYASFSTLSYLVNYRLSIRYLNHTNEEIINNTSLIIYTVCSFFNWIVQLYLVVFYFNTYTDHNILKNLYVFLVCVIVNDDIFLIKFLNKERKKPFKNKILEKT